MESGKIGLDDCGRNCELRSRMSTARVIGRCGSAYTRRRYTKRISVLLVCAAAIVIVLSVATLPLAKGKASELEAAKSARPPGTPFLVCGYVYHADGVTPWPDQEVNITNNNTHSWNLTTSNFEGFYSFDVGNEMDWSVNMSDVMYVTVINGTLIGSGEGIVNTDESYVWIDVTVGTVIPEFPLVLLPVMGLALMVVAAVRYRRR